MRCAVNEKCALDLRAFIREKKICDLSFKISSIDSMLKS